MEPLVQSSPFPATLRATVRSPVCPTSRVPVIAYRSTTVTRRDRSSSRPAAVLMWFVAGYTAPAFPDLSHGLVTLPLIEIDGLCAVSPLARGTTHVLSVILSVAPSQGKCHPVSPAA
jgi:hypothetical protein